MMRTSKKQRRILLASVGSHGDVLPFVALGKNLVQRGHTVTMLTNAYFEPQVLAAGMELAAAGTAEEYEQFLEKTNLWNPILGLWATREIFATLLKRIYTYIEAEWRRDNSIIAASPYCIAARIAQEVMHVQLVTINLAPIALGSSLAPPVVNTRILPEKMPRWMRPAYAASVHWVTDRILGSPINAFRNQLGLPPVHHLMRWWHSPTACISLFPDWFAPPQADWPAHHLCVGFPCSAGGGAAVAPDVERLLAQDRRPILIFPGSGVRDVQSVFDTCARACQKLGRNGIFAAPMGRELNVAAAPHMMVSGFVPIAEVAPRVAAVVHHGGIGTIAACLRAGVPQLIRPMSVDQPDNAVHLAKLGVGEWLGVSSFRVSKIVQALVRLVADKRVGERCHAIQQRLCESRATEVACDAIESLSDA